MLACICLHTQLLLLLLPLLRPVDSHGRARVRAFVRACTRFRDGKTEQSELNAVQTHHNFRSCAWQRSAQRREEDAPNVASVISFNALARRV